MAPFAPLGAALRTLRQRSRQTQHQLAAATGLPAGAISRWERGLAQPDTRALERLLAQLGSDLPALHLALCSLGNPSPDTGSRQSRLAAIERETAELRHLLDELASAAALLLGLGPAARNTRSPTTTEEIQAAPDPPPGPLLLEHLCQTGLLDRWAIEPGTEERELVGSDRLARVQRALEQLRERISFYQRFS